MDNERKTDDTKNEICMWETGKSISFLDSAVNKLDDGLSNGSDEFLIRMFLSRLRTQIRVERLEDCISQEVGEVSERPESGMVSRLRVYSTALASLDIIHTFGAACDEYSDSDDENGCVTKEETKDTT